MLGSQTLSVQDSVHALEIFLLVFGHWILVGNTEHGRDELDDADE